METLPVTLGVRVGRSAFKKGSIPRAVAMPSHSSHSSCLSTFQAPRWGAPVLPPFCCCLRSVTSWGLALFSHRSASRIFIMQPGCSPPPAVTQDDDCRPRGGEERAGPWPLPCPQLQGCSSSVLGRKVRRVGACLRVGSGPLLPSVIGGEGRSPPEAPSAAACLAPRPERLWCCFRCRLLPLGRSVAIDVSTPGGSLDRRVNCRCVSQPRWVSARRDTKGENSKGEPAAFVLSCAQGGWMRLQ
jgi:hypothetical protein